MKEISPINRTIEGRITLTDDTQDTILFPEQGFVLPVPTFINTASNRVFLLGSLTREIIQA